MPRAGRGLRARATFVDLWLDRQDRPCLIVRVTLNAKKPRGLVPLRAAHVASSNRPIFS